MKAWKETTSTTISWDTDLPNLICNIQIQPFMKGKNKQLMFKKTLGFHHH